MPPKCGTILDATEMWECLMPQNCGTVVRYKNVGHSFMPSTSLRRDWKCGNRIWDCVRQRHVGLSYAKEMWDCCKLRLEMWEFPICHRNVGPLRQRNVQLSKAAEIGDCMSNSTEMWEWLVCERVRTQEKSQVGGEKGQGEEN